MHYIAVRTLCFGFGGAVEHFFWGSNSMFWKHIAVRGCDVFSVVCGIGFDYSSTIYECRNETMVLVSGFGACCAVNTQSGVLLISGIVVGVQIQAGVRFLLRDAYQVSTRQATHARPKIHKTVYKSVL